MISFWAIVILYIFHWIFIICKFMIFCRCIIFLSWINAGILKICIQILKIIIDFNSIVLELLQIVKFIFWYIVEQFYEFFIHLGF